MQEMAGGGVPGGARRAGEDFEQPVDECRAMPRPLGAMAGRNERQRITGGGWTQLCRQMPRERGSPTRYRCAVWG
jgi:hypothetical protein